MAGGGGGGGWGPEQTQTHLLVRPTRRAGLYYNLTKAVKSLLN